MGDVQPDAAREPGLPKATLILGLPADHFDVLVDKHYPQLLGYLGRRLGRDLAEDLAAETVAIAYRDRDRYDSSRGSEVSWLFAIATGLLAHHRRTERRRLLAYAKAEPPIHDPDATATSVVDRVAASATLAATAQVLARMSARQRDALYLVAVVGLSYDDAAAALSVPVGTVRSRVSRARTRLRAEIGFEHARQQRPQTEGESCVD